MQRNQGEVGGGARMGWTEYRTGFRRSHKGNLWRPLPDGRTVTIFKRDGRFAWCIAGLSGPRFSTCKYSTEEQAVAAAWRDLYPEASAEASE
jgi:hypothetical protein